MNKKVNELIPKALEAIKQSQMANDANEVDKEYKGYIASMGASIIQSGLIATIAFYSNEQSGSKDKKLKLLTAIHILIANVNNHKLLDFVLNRTKPVNQSSFTAAQLNNLELNKIENEISNTLIALKLALRTFKQPEQRI